MDRLTAMKVFVEVVEKGSLTAAAERLDLSRAVVTRHLAELEAWLGVRLLHRTTRRLSLTDAGVASLVHCRQVLGEIEALQADLGERSSEPKGLIRVTSTSSFGQQHLAPAVADYVLRFPGTQVDLMLLDRTVNLVEERIDLAIRISNELDPALVARRLAVCRSVVCASPAYLARCGAPQQVEELTRHNCLTYAYYGQSEWRFRRGEQEFVVPVSGNISANEVTAITQATLAGAGIAMQPTYMVAPYLRSGALVPLLTGYSVPDKGIYGVYTSRRFVPPILRSLIDFLVERFGDTPAWDRTDADTQRSPRGLTSGRKP
jgi:DNA-binding transcriptional LysR family regulator